MGIRWHCNGEKALGLWNYLEIRQQLKTSEQANKQSSNNLQCCIGAGLRLYNFSLYDWCDRFVGCGFYRQIWAGKSIITWIIANFSTPVNRRDGQTVWPRHDILDMVAEIEPHGWYEIHAMHEQLGKMSFINVKGVWNPFKIILEN